MYSRFYHCATLKSENFQSSTITLPAAATCNILFYDSSWERTPDCHLAGWVAWEDERVETNETEGRYSFALMKNSFSTGWCILHNRRIWLFLGNLPPQMGFNLKYELSKTLVKSTSPIVWETGAGNTCILLLKVCIFSSGTHNRWVIFVSEQILEL